MQRTILERNKKYLSFEPYLSTNRKSVEQKSIAEHNSNELGLIVEKRKIEEGVNRIAKR